MPEWERDLLQPAGSQQSATSPQTAAETPQGDASGGAAGDVATALDEAGAATSAPTQP